MRIRRRLADLDLEIHLADDEIAQAFPERASASIGNSTPEERIGTYSSYTLFQGNNLFLF
jgi:hypothetical protein